MLRIVIKLVCCWLLLYPITSMAIEKLPLEGIEYLSAGDKILYKSVKKLALNQEFLLVDHTRANQTKRVKVIQVVSNKRYIVAVLPERNDAFTQLDSYH